MELAGVDEVRVLKDAPPPGAGTAHSVASSVSFLHAMIGREDTNLEYTTSAYGVSSTSELLEKERKPSKHNCNKDKRAKSHGKQEKTKKKEDNGSVKYTCPYCKTITAGCPITSTRTNACGTRNTKETASRPSATSSR
jgi:hypothetical protein